MTEASSAPSIGGAGEPPPRLQVPRRRKVSVLISIVGLRGLLGVGALEVAPGGFWREGTAVCLHDRCKFPPLTSRHF